MKKLLFFETHHEKQTKPHNNNNKKQNQRDHDRRNVAGTGNNNNLPVQRGAEEARDVQTNSTGTKTTAPTATTPNDNEIFEEASKGTDNNNDEGKKFC